MGNDVYDAQAHVPRRWGAVDDRVVDQRAFALPARVRLAGGDDRALEEGQQPCRRELLGGL